MVAVLRKGWYQLCPKYTTLDWWRQRVSTTWVTPEFLQTPSRHLRDLFSTNNGLRDGRGGGNGASRRRHCVLLDRNRSLDCRQQGSRHPGGTLSRCRNRAWRTYLLSCTKKKVILPRRRLFLWLMSSAMLLFLAKEVKEFEILPLASRAASSQADP